MERVGITVEQNKALIHYRHRESYSFGMFMQAHMDKSNYKEFNEHFGKLTTEKLARVLLDDFEVIEDGQAGILSSYFEGVVNAKEAVENKDKINKLSFERGRLVATMQLDALLGIESQAVQKYRNRK